MSPQQTPLGQYQLIEKIAQGGMAEIFRGKALDTHNLEKPVVIKRILPHIAASPEFVNMLIDEAKIAVMLSHGNIAQVYDLGKVADDYFIVMEYVDGKTLSQIMKRLQIRGELMPIPYALYLCAEVAGGLSYMHEKTDEAGNPLHIVHRDISPQNIILSSAGTVKIIDFGIAKAKTKISTTDSGVVKGKFAYMSPEHAEGEKLDHRTDIFSLGIILFELLTGQRLFKGKNNKETIRNVKRARIAPPSELRDAVDAKIDSLVLKSLERDLTKRYESAFTFRQDLTRLLFEYYPDFSPQELGGFLDKLFPEDNGRDLQEHRSSQSVKTLKEKHQDPEDTKIVSPKSLLARLKHVEYYSQENQEEAKKQEPPPPPAPAPTPKTKEQVRPVRLPLLPIFIVLLVLGGGYALRYISFAQFIPLWKSLQSSFTPSKPLQPAPTPQQSPVATPQLKTEQQSPPEAQPTTGLLLIDSTPPGATIFLNDQELKKTTPAQLEGIPIDKEQKLGLYLDRYRFWEDTIQIDPTKGKTQLTIPLELNYGDLSVVSLPPGAIVYLDGKKAGTTPFTLEKIEPGTSFDILLKRDGYADWAKGVKIFGGKKEVVSASLSKK